MREWRDIPKYGGIYQVSRFGKIRKMPKNQLMSLCRDKDGYLMLGLRKNGIRKMFRVHRLVATVFIPNPEGKKFVNHIDFDVQNNCVTNLEWVTSKENIHHSMSAGRIKPTTGETNGMSFLKWDKVDEIRTLHKLGHKQIDLVKKFNVSKATISNVVNNKSWKNETRPETGTQA